MVSYQEAKSFLENVLEFPTNWEETLKNNKMEFLRMYMDRHQRRVPFQNVTLAAVPVDQRHNPTEEEIIKQGLSGVGGCCLNLNFFTKILFVALGLDAFAIQGTHYLAPVPGTHVMVLVRLDPDELYMVEVGGAFPILDIVPMMSRSLPFTTISAAGFPNEFREISPGIVGRFIIGGGLYAGKYTDKTETLRTSWDLVPKELSDFDHAMFMTFVKPKSSPLLRNPMMCRYFHNPNEVKEFANTELGWKITKDETFSEYFVFVWKRGIAIGNKYERKLFKKYESYQAMAPELERLFPMLNRQEIDKAVEQWSQFEPIHTPYDNII